MIQDIAPEVWLHVLFIRFRRDASAVTTDPA